MFTSTGDVRASLLGPQDRGKRPAPRANRTLETSGRGGSADRRGDGGRWRKRRGAPGGVEYAGEAGVDECLLGAVRPHHEQVVAAEIRIARSDAASSARISSGSAAMGGGLASRNR